MSKADPLLFLNNLLGEKVPNDILILLENSGFDSLLSLEKIDAKDVSEIEEYFKCNPSKLKGTSYENMSPFKLLPGHKKFVLGLPSRIKNIRQKVRPEEAITECSDFAFVFKELIDVATSNSGKDPHGVRYTDVIRYFATYIYLHCGKQCYETLCANLPLPKASTACESNTFSTSWKEPS